MKRRCDVIDDDDDDNDDDELFNYNNKKSLTFFTKEKTDDDSDDDDSSDSDGESSESESDGDIVKEVNVGSKAKSSSSLEASYPPFPPSPPPPPANVRLAPRSRSPMRNDVLNRLRNVSESNLLNSSLELSVIDSPDPEQVMSLKIRIHGTISRYFLSKTKPLSNLYAMLAENENVDPSKIVLNFNNKAITPSDTAKSLGLSIVSIVECLIVDEVIADESSETMITVKLQHERKGTRTEYRVDKLGTLEKTLRAFCEKNSLQYDKCVFELDGERIPATSCLQDTDIEDGDIVDVLVK